MRTMRHLLGAFVLLLLAGGPIVTARIDPPCASASSLNPPMTAAGADRASLQELRNHIHDLVEAGDPPLRRTTPREQDDLRRLYRSAGYSPFWLDSEYLGTQDAEDALALLRESADEGLEPADYSAPVLERGDEPAGLSSAGELAKWETALSAAMLRYLRHVHEGRLDPRSIGFRLNAPDDDHDFAAILRTARAEHRITATAVALTPQLAQYRELRAMLGRYRSLALAARGDGQLPLPTGVIRPGDVYQGAPALQRLLVAVGDQVDSQPASDSAPYYTGALVEGIQRFQRRHGLQPDGIIGERTAAALDVPLAWRVRQIELALERLRWLPHVGHERLLVINIPMFRMWAWDALLPTGQPTFGMDVIVGRALSTETPVFAEDMREVVFRPYWNVPVSILRNELLPAIARDPAVLARDDMEIVRGDGDDAVVVKPDTAALRALRSGAARLRQRPGPRNALGLIKFVFPNEENVYLHGTPAPQLFSSERRDFSHGCVRVQDPVALAQWALEENSGWTRDRIVAATGSPVPIHVQLVRPVQVILFYTTAAVMEDGAIAFAEDIYHHDARLDRALSGPR